MIQNSLLQKFCDQDRGLILLTEVLPTEENALNSWESYKDFWKESLSFILWIKDKQTVVKAVIISLPGRE